MFKKLPYYGWLLIAVLLWGAVYYSFYIKSQAIKPEAMAKLVSLDLQKRQDALDALLKGKTLLNKMFTGDFTSDEVDQLADEPFYIYAFEQDSTEGNILVFWNSNVVVGTCEGNDFFSDDNTLFKNNGTYLKHCIRLPWMKPYQSIVVLFPIAHNYPFQNEYLQSSFVASDAIPTTTKITRQRTTHSYAITDIGNHDLFYLDFQNNDLPLFSPDAGFITGLLTALFFSVLWINLIAISLARKKTPWHGLAVILFSIILFFTLLYFNGLPFQLGDLAIFSPQLYASSVIFPSFGILILEVFCLLWITLYLTSNFSTAVLRFNKNNDSVQLLYAILFTAILLFIAFTPIEIIRSLVLDSKISFDVSNFYSINTYSLMGLVVIAIIISITAVIIYALNAQLSLLLKKHWLKYILIFAIASLLHYILQYHTQYELYVLFWELLFLMLVDFKLFKKYKSLFAPGMIFWGIFLSLSVTLALHYFVEEKESIKRKSFAENIVRQRDDVMEYLFNDISDSISSDKNLQHFIANPTDENRILVNEYVNTKYLRGQFNRYNAEIFFFDKQGKSILNKDPRNFDFFSQIVKNAIPASNDLYYLENEKDGHYYLAEIPLVSNDTTGYLFIDLTLKKASVESVYPELLQPAKIKELLNNNVYTYGIYNKQELTYQTNDFPFPLYLKRDTMTAGTTKELSREDYSIVVYKIDKDKRVAIVNDHKHWLELITHFSYLLGILILLAFVATLLNLLFTFLLREKGQEQIIQLTLRKRLLFSMLGVVLLSFIIIGSVTTMVFIDRYNETNIGKLKASMQIIERSVQQYMKEHNSLPDAISFDVESSTPKFKTFIADLSNSQNIDINIFNSFGSLNATSQEDIYNKLLLARLMMPDAYYQLSKGRSILIEREKIGNLNYLSCYVPLRNSNGSTLGYVNVPFFSSQKELNYQISNILIALINLYVFIFLVSSFVAVFISNWITKGLQMIITRFQKFNLQSNEPLEWTYDDEIGLLIKEYNNMMRKVEENANLLAQSERESAWREMAKQVAHEIKNPLTPMKLNVQYLQNAIKNNHPNVLQLTQNVTESLIEQIENLSYIASAFSDFAKMPEAKPEEIDINELLHKAVDLYKNNSGVKVAYEQVEPLKIFADKSQLLRVITNLIQNSIEAISEDTEGKIIVHATKTDDHVVISIHDNGTGVPENIKDKIFSPYFTTKSSGTGLGLAMTKKIIEFWNGKIWFESKEKEGTTFFVQLPIIKEVEE